MAEDKEKDILNIEESQYCDIKTKLILPSKISQTVSAFANASGGDIYIGINENTRTKERSYDGFSTVEECNKFIQVLESLEGLYENYDVVYLRCKDNTFCMQITILKSNKIVKSTDGSVCCGQAFL